MAQRTDSNVVLPAPVRATISKVLSNQSWTMRTRPKPGSYAEAIIQGQLFVWYMCPCGCGHAGCLRVHLKGEPEPQPKLEPTWQWDRETVTLAPSINHVGHWHGYLRMGMWENA